MPPDATYPVGTSAAAKLCWRRLNSATDHARRRARGVFPACILWE